MAFGGFLYEAVISYQLLVGKKEAVILHSCSQEKRNGHVTGLCINSLHFPFLSPLLLVIVITD